MSTHVETTLQEIAGWPVKDQIELLDRAWDRLVDAGWQPELSDELKEELNRRIQQADAHPERAVSWEQVLEHIRRER